MLWSQEATCTQGGGFWVSSASCPSPTCSSSCPPLVPEDEPVIIFDDEVCLLRPRPLFSQCIRSSPSSTQQQESQIAIDPGDSQWTTKEDGDGNEPSYIQTGGLSTCSRKGPQSGGVYVRDNVLVGPGCVSLAGRNISEEEDIRFISQNGGRIQGPAGGTSSAVTLSEKNAASEETPGPCMSRRAQSDRFPVVTGNLLNASHEPHRTPYSTLKCRAPRETPKQIFEDIPSASQQNCAWGLPPTAPWHRSPYIRTRDVSSSPRKIFCCPEREQGEERLGREAEREEEEREETRQKTSWDEQRGADKEEEQAIMKHFDRSIFLSQTSDEGDTQEETFGIEKEKQENMKCLENGGRNSTVAESAADLQGTDNKGREEKTWEMPRTYKTPPLQDKHIHEEHQKEGRHILNHHACSFSRVNKNGENKEKTVFSSSLSINGPCKHQVYTLTPSHVSSPVDVPKVLTCSASSSPRSCVPSLPALSHTGPSLSSSSCGGCTPVLVDVHRRSEETEVTEKASSSPGEDKNVNGVIKGLSLSSDQPLSLSRSSQHSACLMSSRGVCIPTENSSSRDLSSPIFPISSSHSAPPASSVKVSSSEPSLLSSLSSSSSSSSRSSPSCLESPHLASSPSPRHDTSSCLHCSSSHLASSVATRGSQTASNREQQTAGKDQRAEISREENLLFFSGDEDEEEEDEEDRKTEKADEEVEVGVIEEERKSSAVSCCSSSSSSSPSSRSFFLSSSTCPDNTKSSHVLLKGGGYGCRRRTSEALDDLDELINVDVDYLICSTQTPSSSSLVDNPSSSSVSRSCLSPHRSTSSCAFFPDTTEVSDSSSSPSSSCRRGCHAEGSSSSLVRPSSSSSTSSSCHPSSSCCFPRDEDGVSFLSNAVEKDSQSKSRGKSFLSSEAGVTRQEDPVLFSSRRKDLSSSSSSYITRSPCSSLPQHHTDALSLHPSLAISSPKIVAPEEEQACKSRGCVQPPSAEFQDREIALDHLYHDTSFSVPPSLSYERVLSRGTPPLKRQTLTQNSPHASRQCLVPSPPVFSPDLNKNTFSSRSTPSSSSSTHLRPSISSLTPNHLVGGNRIHSSSTLHPSGKKSVVVAVGPGVGTPSKERPEVHAVPYAAQKKLMKNSVLGIESDQGRLWNSHGGEIPGIRQESMAERGDIGHMERDRCLNWTAKKPSLSSEKEGGVSASCSYREAPHGGAMGCRVNSSGMVACEKQQTFEDRRLRSSSSSRDALHRSTIVVREDHLNEEKTKKLKERHEEGDTGDHPRQITRENASTSSLDESLEFNPDEEAFLQMMDEENF